MDIQMPVMSGIEATLAIREIEKGKGSRVPIVALTAGAIKGEMERCFEAGMDDFLTKPLDQNKLLRILGKYLSFIAQF
jgi:CheY-like chemotaxis protein